MEDIKSKTEIIKYVLASIAQENNFGNYEIKIKAIGNDGENYSSTLYNITVQEEGNTHLMIAKFAALGEQVRLQIPGIYETEIFAYKKLANVYKRLESEHQIPSEHKLSLSKFYGCNTSGYKEVISLENLIVKGYQLHDRFKSIDWNYAASAVTELSKMHALSFAYSIYYSESFKDINMLKFECNIEKDHLSDYFDMTRTRAIETVQEENRDRLQRFFKTFKRETFSQYFIAKRPVIAHLDFRTSNLLYKIRDDGTVDIKILDLQTLQIASPVLDLLYFIVTSTDETFRAQYYKKLVDHYYTELEEAIKRFHLDPEELYSKSDFEIELKERLPYGFIIAVMALPIVTVSTENAPKVNKEMGMSDFTETKDNDLYKERINGIVHDYIKWGVIEP